MASLTEFLLARIAEDEDNAVAAGAYGPEWLTEDDDAGTWSTIHADDEPDIVGCSDGNVTHHIARHDPARVLAECKVRRRIVEDLESLNAVYPLTYDPTTGGRLTQACMAVQHLAAVYADHPDYNEAWCP